MFYLLEDNRIIDSQIPYAHAKSLPFWEDKVGHLRAKDRTGKSYQVFKYDKIIKQSDNVFDLIEKGDLVKVQYYGSVRPCLIFDVNSIFTYEDGIKEFTILGMSWTENQVLAIYKPDAKGNYIKVWERKEK